jgi:8-oxo-dGTP diphosphatase
MFNKHDELAVLQMSWGMFLPGGGVDPGETDLVGLARELREEMGVVLLKAEFLCRSGQLLFSRHYQTHFRKIGSFYRVEVEQPIRLKMQDGHELLWMDRRQASLELSEEFQRWALERL